MNTTHHRSAWGVALAAIALTLTTACGSEEVPTAPEITDVGAEERTSLPDTPDTNSGVRPGRLPDAWD